MKLSTRLILIFLAVGLVPAIILGGFSVYEASSSLSQQSFNKLQAVRGIKKSQIEAFFAERKGDMSILSETVSTLYQEFEDVKKVETILSAPRVAGQQGFFEKYVTAYEYYDLFLINKQGDVFFTVSKEADFGTNLLTGPYRESGLAKLFKQVKSSRSYGLQDFSPYAPSNNEPAAFIGQPIYHNNELVMVVALQLSIEKINSIMQLRDGMGETGESYLVGQDMLMRSDSYLDPQGHSVKASFAGTVAKNGVNTSAVTEALAGKTAIDIINDYNNHPVLSAYTPVNVEGHTWALIAEIDEAEAFHAVTELEWIMFILAIIVITAVMFIAVQVSRSVTRPLGGEPKEMQYIAERIAAGDLTLKFNNDAQKDSVYGAMARMSQNLHKLVNKIMVSSSEIARASEETSVVTKQTNRNVQLQQDETHQVSSAINEMSASGQQVSSSTVEASNAANSAAKEAASAKGIIENTVKSIQTLSTDVSESAQAIQSLAEDTDRIGSVLDVIKSIAEQTNLLALNAAIEAARAGEQGRGFAVVADEVRSLAQKTQDSTSNIENMISQLQNSADKASAAMNRSMDNTQRTISSAEEAGTAIATISLAADNIYDMNVQIASASEQQNSAVEEINQNIISINQIALETSGGAQQTAEATLELARLAEQLRETIDGFKV